MDPHKLMYIRKEGYKTKPELKLLDKILVQQIDLNLALLEWTRKINNQEKYVATIQYFSNGLYPTTLNVGYWAIQELNHSTK